MNEEQLKLLYDSYASKNGFSDYNEFKSLIGNDSSRKVFFESSKKELGFKDYNEFNDLVGLKKKRRNEKAKYFIGYRASKENFGIGIFRWNNKT